ncbi:hypothetical protein D187_003650 [Cystobacter fuscus DSM 2262]|uniref:Uncharacterized protein n=1 Tax=Cystobacter fuscus (strain ATCC 25194 / DSM 2262 / NBRC 100088 / M29) TaxID=1242864 RepID=S9P385_CYSF2|nr:hypothetical protein D187_003650 [Cystobacter fuscus DSM 2262]
MLHRKLLGGIRVWSEPSVRGRSAPTMPRPRVPVREALHSESTPSG